MLQSSTEINKEQLSACPHPMYENKMIVSMLIKHFPWKFAKWMVRVRAKLGTQELPCDGNVANPWINAHRERGT